MVCPSLSVLCTAREAYAQGSLNFWRRHPPSVMHTLIYTGSRYTPSTSLITEPLLLLVAQSWLTLWLPGSSPWDSPGKNIGVGCISFFREFSQPRDWTLISHITGRFLSEPPGKPWLLVKMQIPSLTQTYWIRVSGRKGWGLFLVLSLHLTPYATHISGIYFCLAESTVINYENLGIDYPSVGMWETGDGWGWGRVDFENQGFYL